MNRREAIGTMSLGAALQGVEGMRARFIGVWKLISCVRTGKDGRTDYPYGEQPVGRLTYDQAGRMSAQLMRPGRRTTVPAGQSLGAGNTSAEEIREAVSGYIGYFGRFEVDESSSTVIHHVQACLVPSWVGTDLKRKYRFEGNRLRLVAESADNSIELVWEKEAD